MRLLPVLLFCTVLSLLTSCGYSAPSMNAGGPMITQVVPDSARSATPGVMLTINGTGFGTDAVVFWNMSMLPATYITGNQLTVVVPAADLASPMMASVYVRSRGQNSNMVGFTVN